MKDKRPEEMSAEELDRKLSELIHQEQGLHSEVIRAIKEIESDKTWVGLGYKSLLEFCEKELEYSQDEARQLLIEAGLILTADQLRAEDPAVQERIDRLLKWRREKSAQLKVPAYRIVTNRTLLALATENPQKFFQLLQIPGVGKKKMVAFGEELIEVLKSIHSN